MQFSNGALTNVDGLSSLTAVGGNLIVVGTGSTCSIGNDSRGLQTSNSVLTNVDGLSSLTTVGGDVQLVGQGSSSLLFAGVIRLAHSLSSPV